MPSCFTIQQQACSGRKQCITDDASLHSALDTMVGTPAWFRDLKWSMFVE